MVVNIDVHVFVEVVSRTHFDVFNQIIAAEPEVFTFSLNVADGRTQTEVELILSNGFEVLSFVSEPSASGHVAGFAVVHDCQVDVVCVVFQPGCPCFSFVAFAVSFLGTVRSELL
jgi:hypothetical protein